MKTALTVFCPMVLAVMPASTVFASLHQDILTALRLLWREDSISGALTWLILILVLGNFAMAGYVLLELRRCSSVDDLFRRKVRPT